jgi:hypothetical protein
VALKEGRPLLRGDNSIVFYYLSAFEIMIERRVWPLVRGSAFEIMIERRVWPLVRGSGLW